MKPINVRVSVTLELPARRNGDLDERFISNEYLLGEQLHSRWGKLFGSFLFDEQHCRYRTVEVSGNDLQELLKTAQLEIQKACDMLSKIDVEQVEVHFQN